MPIVVQQSTNRIVVQEAGARVIRAAGPNRIVANSTAVTIRPRVSRRVVCREGPRGLPGNGAAYLHTQDSAATTWTIPHNLGYRPNVELRTVGGVVMDGQITHVSDNLTTVAFAYALAGSARLL